MPGSSFDSVQSIISWAEVAMDNIGLTMYLKIDWFAFHIEAMGSEKLLQPVGNPNLDCFQHNTWFKNPIKEHNVLRAMAEHLNDPIQQVDFISLTDSGSSVNGREDSEFSWGPNIWLRR